ncbi:MULTISPECIES: GTP-binding protein [unclassified Bacillus (in: firmicutes)]|uniref:CobW family GTP-binding protein n=1 Tax=unclassified Bacillus (in: firmicutes) TaxID=185979 RepID=UPI0008E50C5D|nr:MULTISPECIES: GTP-binding protein [unclassified Bacillus (in: firmicutes)]SFA91951.1 GTPase, G3E family [Bacillus sp. UNCCL13]SFQ85733.1 GTPase, G3E family [Bacillus sp. cl95]
MKTEVYILSGFLGSGKTTLLKRLLEAERNASRKVAVMMNELGKVSIDSNAIEEDVALKELLGGCICCTIQGQVEAQIQGLLMDAKPEVIYIETTGAAHPVEVLDAVLSPLFAEKLNVKGIITTIDGQRWLQRKSLSPQLQQLVLEQTRSASLVIVNKMDELSDSEQAKISYEIQSINPNAKCVLTTFSSVSIKLLKNEQSFDQQTIERPKKKETTTLSTFVYQFKSAISQTDFEDFLRGLPDSIYRIKGYVKFNHSSLPYLFQFSYGMPLYMKEDMNLPLNLVFIGENIDWNEISSSLKSLERTVDRGTNQ